VVISLGVVRFVAMSFAKSCMARPIEKLWSNDESHKTKQAKEQLIYLAVRCALSAADCGDG